MANSSPSAVEAPNASSAAVAPAPLSTVAGAPEAPSAAAEPGMFSLDGGAQLVSPWGSLVTECSFLGHSTIGQSSMGSWTHVHPQDQHWFAMNSRGTVVGL